MAASGIKQNLARTGVEATGAKLVSPAELRTSVFYREFLSAIPIDHFLVAMVDDGLNPDKNAPEFAAVLPTHISFFRRHGPESFNQDDKARLTQLHPHFLTTFNLDCQWRAMQVQLNVFHSGVKPMDFGVAFVDAAGRVWHANSPSAADF